MKYKNLYLAFLIEILVGFGTILSISLLGYRGLISLVLLALRPLLLQKEQIENGREYWQFSYKILSGSLMIILLMIISLFAVIQFIPFWKSRLPETEVLLILIIPFFLMTHGVLGFLNLTGIEKRK